MKTAVVILAGGSGTRLWPLSRNKAPKQFTALVNDKSLIRNTYERVVNDFGKENIFISTGLNFIDYVSKEIPEVDKDHLIVEPKRMDTAGTFGLISLKLKELGYTTVINLASDHYIGNVEEFVRVLKLAEEVNKSNPNNLLAIGLSPSYPATGYGYIEMGSPVGRFGKDIVFSVQSFTEKPDRETAQKFIEDWKYLWNANWFVFSPDYMIEQYKLHLNATLSHLENCYNLEFNSEKFLEEYSQCDKTSFEFGIVEKLKDILVIPASVGWSDIGFWKSVHEIITGHRKTKNVFVGNVISEDTKGTLVYSTDKKKLISVLGVKDLVVVDTGDALLVTTIDKSQDVKKIVEQLPEELK